MKTKKLTITYQDKNNNKQIKTVKIGDLVMIHSTIVQVSYTQTGLLSRSEYEEDEFCAVHSFVKDVKNEYTSFLVIKLTQKRKSQITKRVYFQQSGDIYDAARFTFLQGTVDDYPEYFL